jgi:hypothetical protein
LELLASCPRQIRHHVKKIMRRSPSCGQYILFAFGLLFFNVLFLLLLQQVMRTTSPFPQIPSDYKYPPLNLATNYNIQNKKQNSQDFPQIQHRIFEESPNTKAKEFKQHDPDNTLKDDSVPKPYETQSQTNIVNREEDSKTKDNVIVDIRKQEAVAVEKKSSKKRVTLLIGILSAPSYRNRRDLIRQTWFRLGAEHKGEGWIATFIIGTQELSSSQLAALQEENEQFHDLTFVPMRDAYSALSLKVLLFFKHCLENYDFDYLLKTDDDAFVRPDTLMKYIKYFPKTRLYMGTYRDYKGKIGPIQESRLPQVYAGGAGYILSPDCVQYLVECYFVYHKELIVYEDLLMGYWLGTINVKLMYPPIFFECDEDAVLMHYIHGEQFKTIYERVIRGEKSMCDQKRIEKDRELAAKLGEDAATIWQRNH